LRKLMITIATRANPSQTAASSSNRRSIDDLTRIFCQSLASEGISAMSSLSRMHQSFTFQIGEEGKYITRDLLEGCVEFPSQRLTNLICAMGSFQ